MGDKTRKNEKFTKELKKNMEEKFQKEFQDLTNLEAEGTLDDAQASRLSVLKIADTAEKTAEAKSKDLQSALAQKDHFRTKAEEAEKLKLELEEKLKSKDGESKGTAIDPLEIATFTSAVKDYSVEELEFIMKNATDKSTKGIIAAAQDEMVQMAIQGKRIKVAEEKKVLATTNKQKDAEKPKSTEDRLTQAAATSLEDLGNVLREKGLYKDPHRRPDRVVIK